MKPGHAADGRDEPFQIVCAFHSIAVAVGAGILAHRGLQLLVVTVLYAPGPMAATALFSVVLQMHQHILLAPGKTFSALSRIPKLFLFPNAARARSDQQPPAQRGQGRFVFRVENQHDIADAPCLVAGSGSGAGADAIALAKFVRELQRLVRRQDATRPVAAAALDRLQQ